MTHSPPSRQARIDATLRQIFQPALLEVIDESHQHAGHAGARPGGETHYRVRMQAATFAGLSRVEMHRRVNAALQSEFDGGLHALALDLKGA